MSALTIRPGTGAGGFREAAVRQLSHRLVYGPVDGPRSISRTRTERRGANRCSGVDVVSRSSTVTVTLAASLAFVTGTAAGGGQPWDALRRPLHLPKLAAGATCPVSHVDHRVS